MVCKNCITNSTLQLFIENHGDLGQCSICDETTHCIRKKELLAYIFERFKESYCDTRTLSSYEQGMIFEASADIIDIHWLENIVSEHFEMGNDEICDEVIEYIGSNLDEYDDGTTFTYALNDGTHEHNSHQTQWNKLRHDICHGHRFFSDTALSILNTIFEPVSSNGIIKPSLIIVLTENDVIYRARVTKSHTEREAITSNPASELGPPPIGVASSQRMTPSGISAMYCSFDRDTCLSEIRSITGDIVVSGGFEPYDKLNFLNLKNIENHEHNDLNPLEPGFSRQSHANVFLKKLVRQMSKPKGRHDELSYLSTQLVFEFLRKQFLNQIDGVIFPSVQTGHRGLNVVLFPEHSTTASIVSDRIDNNNPPKLTFKEESLRYHEIIEIKTYSRDFKDLAFVALDDLTRQRLGQNFGVEEANTTQMLHTLQTATLL